MDARFEVGRRLGQGGCSVVYQAYDRATRREVALKVLPEDVLDRVSVARLAREGRASMAIRHPNVCATYERGLLDDGRAYIAMERLVGETLRDRLLREGRLAADDVVELGLQTLAGLDAAHAAGLVHRDIKPENIFLVHDRNRLVVKLMDFGTCRSGTDALDQQTLTCAGFVVGTMGYLAPEQVYGDRTIDPRADLFAVGLVLFEALTGRAAFRGRSPRELAEELTKPVPRASAVLGVPSVLDRTIARATERERAARHPNAKSFQRDLHEARVEIGASASPPEPVHPLPADAPEMWDLPTRRMTASPRRVA